LKYILLKSSRKALTAIHDANDANPALKPAGFHPDAATLGGMPANVFQHSQYGLSYPGGFRLHGTRSEIQLDLDARFNQVGGEGLHDGRSFLRKVQRAQAELQRADLGVTDGLQVVNDAGQRVHLPDQA
jgi:hypothetical protein